MSEELREVIESLTPDLKREKLPRTGKAIIGALRRVAPGLRVKRPDGKHIDVQLPTGQETSGERRGQRLIRIAWHGKVNDTVLSADLTAEGPNPYALATGATGESPF